MPECLGGIVQGPTANIRLEQVLDIAKEVNSENFWVALFDTGKIPAEQFLGIAKKFHSPVFWSAVFETVDLGKATHRLTDKQSWMLATKVDRSFLWRYVYRRIDFSKLSDRQLLKLAQRSCDYEITQAVIERIDISRLNVGQLLWVGNHTDSPDCWQKVFKQIALLNLTDKQWIRIACEVSRGKGRTIWPLVVRRIDLSKFTVNQLLWIGEKANIPEIWELVADELEK